MAASPAQELRLAVIGAGIMGRNHVRVCDGLKNVTLAGIYEPDRRAAAEVAAQYGCRSFASLEEVLHHADAVSVCSPSVTHAEIGHFFLSRGVHCLIEKPLATAEADCLALIDAAERSGAKLLVGHIERFNPAVQQVMGLLENGTTVHAIDARRLSAVGSRIKDVDVVLDLMVHDLDIVCALMKRPVVSLSAAGVRTYDSPGGDHVTCLACFEGGAIANVTASRITQQTVRLLSIVTDQGVIAVDYMNQSVEVYRRDNVIVAASHQRFGDYALDVSMERILVRRTEPLRVELAHFVDIVRHDGEPMVTGRDALEILRLVWRIHDYLNAEPGRR